MAEIVSNILQHPAQQMKGDDRKILALESLKQKQTVVSLAQENQVSRQFIHEQKNKLLRGADETFAEKLAKEEEVLFYIPVTKIWLEQVVISLVLDCRASLRGVMKSLQNLFDYHMSLGKISQIVKDIIQWAIAINEKQDLNNVVLGAHDELFHQNKPVLAGVDINSLYCYLLSHEESRDGDTWGIHLFDLVDQGFNPTQVFSDDANGLALGHATALPNTPIHFDNFHLINDLVETRRFFRNRLKTAETYQIKILDKMEKAKRAGSSQKQAKNLGLANQDVEKMQLISQTFDTLADWMMHDVLNKAGPNPAVRKELYQFIVDEFEKLAVIHPHRIRTIVTTLTNQAAQQLAFVDVLDTKFSKLAEKHGYPLEKIWQLCELQRCQHSGLGYAFRSLPLQDYFKENFDCIEDAVLQAMDSTERTSAMVENLNSRLKPYFLLRQEIGYGFLDLLRFYLNHSPLLRSEREERHKKTPAEILTKAEHPHWLEMLGYQLFKKAA